MKNKLYTFIIVFMLVVLIFLVLQGPNLYFQFYDKKSTQKYKIQELNLTNIYDNYHLSNKQKLDILLSEKKEEILLEEKLLAEDYKVILEDVVTELYKIDENFGHLLQSYLLSSYEDNNDGIQEVFSVRSYISCNHYDALTIRTLYYGTSKVEIMVSMDIYDNTILNFIMHELNLLDHHSLIEKQDSLDLQEKVLDYLDITESDYWVDTILSPEVVGFQVYDVLGKNIASEMEY